LVASLLCAPRPDLAAAQDHLSFIERMTVMMTSPLPSSVLLSIQRSLTHVKDAGGQLHAAADVLDPLDAAGLAFLRDRTQRDRAAGLRTFHCPDCDTAVSVVVHSYSHTGIAGGGRAFFRHCGGAAARACVAATDIARAPGAVDAARFNGIQEGPRHHAHKNLFAAMLEADPRFNEVVVERGVRHNGVCYRPDVQARFGGTRIAFEIQHASPLKKTVHARIGFYAAAGYLLIWLVDGNAPDQMLFLQGFQDLTLLQGGDILALDNAGLAMATRQGRAQATLTTLNQTNDRLDLTREPIDLAAGIARFAKSGCEDLPLISTNLLSRQMFTALRSRKLSDIRAAVETLCHQECLPRTGSDAVTCGLPTVIAVLGTLFTGYRSNEFGFGERDPAAVLDRFLSIRRYAVWSPLLARTAGVSPRAADLLARDGIADKLARALDAVAGDPPVSDPIALWTPVIASLFPRLGRIRIGGNLR
jgi:hypothetical protein